MSTDLSFGRNLYSCTITFSERTDLIFEAGRIKHGRDFISRFQSTWKTVIESSIESFEGSTSNKYKPKF